jgi:hypothetical protein
MAVIDARAILQVGARSSGGAGVAATRAHPRKVLIFKGKK